MSIEWSRIEPEEGRIQSAEIDHYRSVLSTLRELGIEPWVTLHHFTLPLWFARRGGFTRVENVAAFGRFVEQVARGVGDLVDHWCTINEPTIHAEMGYRFGYFPPRLADADTAVAVLANLFRAHTAAAEALRAFPILNASVDGDAIVYHHDVNVGVAVALDAGLIVPVVKHADTQDLAAIGAAVADLATRARAKQLKPEEVAGGTFSVTTESRTT